MHLTRTALLWRKADQTCRRDQASRWAPPRRGHSSSRVLIVRAQQQPDDSSQQDWLRARDSSHSDLVFPSSLSFPPPLVADWRAFRARLVAMEQGAAALAAQMHLRPDARWAHGIAAPERGALLVARKQNLGMFTQSVVLILEHDDAAGTTGLVINMPTPLLISHLGVEEELASSFGRCPLFIGGPLGKERLHILHGRRDVEDSMEVIDGVYIGGLEHATEQVLRGEASPSDFQMLCGYAQWGPWQLAQELRGDTWWVVAASTGVVQDCMKEVSTWDPNSQLPPMASAEAVKRRCWEGVLLEAGVDYRAVQ